MFTYGLIDDLNENLNHENKEFFDKIVYSENYEKYLEMKWCGWYDVFTGFKKTDNWTRSRLYIL